MNSGIADVVPLVASEKNVDACVVSSLLEKVYDDWKAKPAARRRRTSTMSALYQDSPSLLLSSMVEKAVFCRGVPAGMNSVPSGSVTGSASVDVAAAQQVLAARAGVADRQRGVQRQARAAR